jgi:Pyruvate/2-oxoacid:ferredoxin oxidoreductase delta subunit
MRRTNRRKRRELSRGEVAVCWVMPESVRCVQCGICSFYCPVEIDVRRHAWLHQPVKDSYCLTCGECVSRCPRGVLRFEPAGSLANG